MHLFAPYGSVRYSDQIMPTDYNFTGQRLDSQTGLLYYNARYYDPVSGRFTTSDMVQNNTKGMDSYAYVGDNPVVRTDPSGKCWPVCTAIAGAIIGGIVGAAVSIAQQTRNGGKINWGAVGGAAAGGAAVGALIGAVGPVVVAGGAAVVGGASLTAAATVTTVEATSALSVGLSVGSVASSAAGASGLLAQDLSCSFTPETVVTTSGGKKAIGTLHVGDRVLAYNPQTHRMELQPILHVWVHSDSDLVNVTLSTVTKQKEGKTSTQKELLHTTSEHPFLTKEKGFLPAGQLKPGMHVLRADGSFGVVTGRKLVSGTTVMYNLTVQQDHTFTVGNGQWVVHNICANDQMRAQREILDSKLIRKNGPGAGPTRSISSLEDASTGQIIAEGYSDTQKTDPVFGQVRCSEGNCLINAYQRDELKAGSTYNMYTTQKNGLPACSDFCGGQKGSLQLAADVFQIDINAYSDDAIGGQNPTEVYTPYGSWDTIGVWDDYVDPALVEPIF